MRISVGIDVAKEIHWATAVDEAANVLWDGPLDNTPDAVDALIARLRGLPGEVVIGLDVLGSIAAFLQACLLAEGFTLVYVPGVAVNRARQGYSGGERKCDKRDARVIAEQVRIRRDLRRIHADNEATIAVRLLVGRRRDLMEEQNRRLSRIHYLLAGVHPELERQLDLTSKSALWLLSKYVSPTELRHAGKARVTAHLRKGGQIPRCDELATLAVDSARAQRVSVPGEQAISDMVRELIADALSARARVIAIDRELERLVDRHADGALLRSIPGMGVVLSADFIAAAGSIDRFRSADALAATSGLAPVLKQSGKTRYFRSPRGGDKHLKRVFYQSAYCSLSSPESRAFYDRKRSEGKRHQQALIALARRRIDVLWAMLRSRKPYQIDHRSAA